MEYLARKRMKKENEICHETFIEMFNAVQSYYRAKITFVCINVFCHQGIPHICHGRHGHVRVNFF